MRRSSALLAGGLLVVGLAACDTTGPQMGQVSVYLTDSPAPTVASAMVTVSRVYLVGSSGDGSESQFTIRSMSHTYELLDLQNGLMTLLGSAAIPAGDYEQLRLVVDSAKVTLMAGTFADGSTSKTLKTPSGMQSGIKVNFGGAIHVPAEGQTGLLVDFDVSENFVSTGPPTSPMGVLFTPVLHGTVM